MIAFHTPPVYEKELKEFKAYIIHLKVHKDLIEPLERKQLFMQLMQRTQGNFEKQRCKPSRSHDNDIDDNRAKR